VKPRRRPSRHLVYFALVDALAEAGCPVCTLGLRAVERYLDGLAYEQVNDPGVRAVLRDAHGFCTRHAWQFVDLPHSHLGTAIIYCDIAATLLRGLTRRPLLLPWAGRSAAVRAGALVPRRTCPACAVLREASVTALRALIDYLDADDPELRRRYQTAAGLCRPHLAAALPLARRARTWAMLTTTAAAALNAAAEPSVATTAVVELVAGKEGAVSTVAAEEQGRGRTNARDDRNRVCPHESRVACPAVLPAASTTGRDVPPSDGGCLACAGALAAADDVLRRLAAEPGAHRAGAAPSSLCNRHVWRLVRVTPLTGQRAVEDALAALPVPGAVPQGTSGGAAGLCRLPRHGWRRDVTPDGRSGGVCLVCRAEAAAAHRALTGVGETAGVEELPWCVPHTLLAVPAVPRGLALRLLTAQAAQLARLMADLDRAIRKHDYRFRDEPWGGGLRCAPPGSGAHRRGARAGAAGALSAGLAMGGERCSARAEPRR